MHRSGITILAGPNGYGKTTLLRLVDAALRLDLDAIRSIEFAEFHLEGASAAGLHIRKNPRDLRGILLDFEMRTPKGASYEFSADAQNTILSPKLSGDYESFANALSQFISAGEDDSAIVRLPGGKWRRSNGELATEADLQQDFLQAYGSMLAGGGAVHLGAPLVRPMFLEAQRLYGEHQQAAVGQVADLVQQHILQAREEFSKVSQKIDREFPAKLLRKTVPDEYTPAAVHHLSAELSKLWRHYLELGLLQAQPLGVFGRSIQKDRIPIAMLFLNDQRRKLDSLASIEARLTLLIALVNEHLELGKKLSVCDDGSLSISDRQGRGIALRGLSSGEQHLLVLFARLLFNEPPAGLVMIDEPELSLHPSWKQSFITSIERIRAIAPADFVFATHSPTLVEGYEAHLVDLWSLAQ